MRYVGGEGLTIGDMYDENYHEGERLMTTEKAEEGDTPVFFSRRKC